ncbi:MAG: hypothetical protein U0526_04370 [Candidatus Saccharibacteria bacterium]|jgi:hypothetical protein
MSDQAWDQLVDLIDQKYEIDNHKKTKEPLEDHPDLSRTIDAIFFEKDNQKFKIERVTSPAVVDTKTHYARSGTAQRVEKKYDPEETVHRVAFYQQQSDGYWNEIPPEALMS